MLMMKLKNHIKIHTRSLSKILNYLKKNNELTREHISNTRIDDNRRKRGCHQQYD